MTLRSPKQAATCVVIGCALMGVYLANGRSIGAGDAAPAILLAAAVADGDGLVLDRYRPIVAPGRAVPYWAAERHGRLVSKYPVAPAVMAAPFFWLQMRALDRLSPEWRTHGYPPLLLMGKNVAALFAAIAGVLLFLVLRQVTSGSALWAAMVAATLGSEMWVVASQSLWSHGPAVLALSLAIALVLGHGHDRTRLLAAGAAGGTVFACRIPSAIYVVPLAIWVLMQDWRRAGWFFVGLVPVMGIVIGYNTVWFASWQGGAALIQLETKVMHGVRTPWTVDVVHGAAGTLFSPNRGLFVYCPWAALALAALPFYWHRLARHGALALLAASLVPGALMLSAYSTWWGGWCFGPRYWTDATPVLAILLAACLGWARECARALRLVVYASIAVAVSIQVVGIIFYPSSWNGYPTHIDLDHGRLWDWRDTEIMRCLREGPHPAAFHLSSQDALDSAFGIARRPPAGSLPAR